MLESLHKKGNETKKILQKKGSEKKCVCERDANKSMELAYIDEEWWLIAQNYVPHDAHMYIDTYTLQLTVIVSSLLLTTH